MKVSVERADKMELFAALKNSEARFIPDAEGKVSYLSLLSQYTWVGKADDEIVCAFGVIPPSVLSNTAYLWSFTTDKVEDHKFLFVRYSQRMLERIHAEFPRIIGHVKVGETRSIRWLRWLGAVFGEPGEKGIPFVIERKNHGA